MQLLIAIFYLIVPEPECNMACFLFYSALERTGFSNCSIRLGMLSSPITLRLAPVSRMANPLAWNPPEEAALLVRPASCATADDPAAAFLDSWLRSDRSTYDHEIKLFGFDYYCIGKMCFGKMLDRFLAFRCNERASIIFLGLS